MTNISTISIVTYENDEECKLVYVHHNTSEEDDEAVELVVVQENPDLRAFNLHNCTVFIFLKILNLILTRQYSI